MPIQVIAPHAHTSYSPPCPYKYSSYLTQNTKHINLIQVERTFMEIIVVYSEDQLQFVGRNIMLYGFKVGEIRVYETYNPSEEKE
jgi:hypothetical protein